MYRQRSAKTIMASGTIVLAIAAAGCNRDRDTRPVAEVQSQTAQPANQPVTVSGCLKAGEAADTYVLTAAKSEGSGDTATYQLVGSQVANMKDHLGRRVEVNGTIVAQQEIASTASPLPADKERPAGTSGTPTVQTRTELDIKRLTVASVKPLGDKCDM